MSLALLLAGPRLLCSGRDGAGASPAQLPPGPHRDPRCAAETGQTTAEGGRLPRTSGTPAPTLLPGPPGWALPSQSAVGPLPRADLFIRRSRPLSHRTCPSVISSRTGSRQPRRVRWHAGVGSTGRKDKKVASGGRSPTFRPRLCANAL